VVSEPIVRDDWLHNHNTKKCPLDWSHNYNKKGITIHLKGNIPYEKRKKKGTHPWEEIVRNSPSVSQSLTLDRKYKVKHYIKIKTHNTIDLRFWCKTHVKCLICARLMPYNHMEPQSLNDYNHNPYITKTYEKIYNPTRYFYLMCCRLLCTCCLCLMLK